MITTYNLSYETEMWRDGVADWSVSSVEWSVVRFKEDISCVSPGMRCEKYKECYMYSWTYISSLRLYLQENTSKLGPEV